MIVRACRDYNAQNTCYSFLMESTQLKLIIEAAIFAAGEPMTSERLLALFEKEQRPTKTVLNEILAELATDYCLRGICLKQTASGYCFYTSTEVSQWVGRLWTEKRPRYSAAFLETLAIIAYKQPVTRADIEAIRGVAVRPAILKLLLAHKWVRPVGQREVPGRPTLYATTQQFLDHFDLKALAELPPLISLPAVQTEL